MGNKTSKGNKQQTAGSTTARASSTATTAAKPASTPEPLKPIVVVDIKPIESSQQKPVVAKPNPGYDNTISPSASPSRQFSQMEENAAMIIQRTTRRQQAKKNAVMEQHWKLFAELDTHSEAETIQLAKFFQAMLDSVPEDPNSDINSMSALENRSSIASPNEGSSENNTSINDDHDVMRLENIEVDGLTTPVVHGEISNFDIGKNFLTPEVLEEIIEVYRRRGKLHTHTVMKILRSAYRILKDEGPVMHLSIENQDKCTVVGDIHGNIDDLLHILDESGLPGPTNKYIFNGDFVDRGDHSVEVITLLFCCLAVHPQHVLLNRGNHEDGNICRVYGFQSECMSKYDDLVYGMFVEVFRYLPLVCIVNEKIMVIHGGLFSLPDVTIDDIAEIDRLDYVAKPDVDFPGNTVGLDAAQSRKELLKQLQREILWSDPHHMEGTTPSQRGVGVNFGADVAAKFMQANDIAMIIRSHECVRDGFELPFAPVQASSPISGRLFAFGAHSPTTSMKMGDFGGSGAPEGVPPLHGYPTPLPFPLLCTLFSSSNYCGGDNVAAFLVLYPHANHHSSPIGDTNLYFSIHRYRTSSVGQQGLQHKNKLSLRELVRSKYAALNVAFGAMDVLGTGSVTRAQWAEVLLQVTRIRIRWSVMVDAMVPPECILPHKGIDYVKFLRSMVESEEPSAGTGSTKAVDFYGSRRRLVAVFNFFDVNRDGVISREEFQKGCAILNSTIPNAENKLTDIDHMMDIMDFDHSGSITLNELFEVFRLLDAADGKVDGEITLAKNAPVV